MVMRLNWRGGDVKRAVDEAVQRGIDDTMAAAVNEGKSNHPGWKNITGTAEGSIAIQVPARMERDGLVGRWGSQGVRYMLPLEVKRGAALRSAADNTYPTLSRRIKEHLK